MSRHRCREGETKGAEIHAERHGVHGAPEGAVADGRGGGEVYGLPGLDYTTEEDGSADIRACKLESHIILAPHIPPDPVSFMWRRVGLTYITQNHAHKPHPANGANSPRLLDPMVPSVRENGYPAFCD
jgi:hypothetical protein